MTIGIDARLWGETGVGRYIRNLIYEIDKKESSYPSQNIYKVFLRKKDLQKVKFKSKNIFKQEADIPWHGISEQILLPKVLRESHIDLMHFPYFSVPIFYKRPFIVTIHDVIINRYPTGKASTLPYPIYMLKRAGYKFVLGNAVKHARKIIIPSNAVKNDLKSIFPKLSLSKTEVIYEGGFDSKGIRSVKNPIPDKKYFLRVGNMYPHKNLSILLEGFSKLIDSQKYSDYFLVLVGKKDYFYKEVEIKIREYGLVKNVIFVENPNDETLKSLYENSIASIVPSLMEGFSLTSLEALSVGCPVIVSDIPVHKEICADAVLYFDPKQPEDLKRKMEYVIKLKEDDREKLVKKGIDRSREFSWKDMADKTLSIYEDVFKTIKSEDYFIHL